MTSEPTTAAGRALAESLPEDVEMNGGVVNARWLRERIAAIEQQARAAAERDVAALTRVVDAARFTLEADATYRESRHFDRLTAALAALDASEEK